MASNHTFVCVPCRTTARRRRGDVRCPSCGAAMLNAGSRWRAPRRSNDRAWALIAQGQWSTEPVAPAGDWRHPAPQLPYTFTSRRSTPTARRGPTAATEAVHALLRRLADPESGEGRADHTDEVTPFARHPDAAVRRTLAAHEATPLPVLLGLSSDPDPQVVAAVARHRAVRGDTEQGRAVLRRAARHRDPAVRLAVAQRDDSPRRVLLALAQDRDPAVASAALAHPVVPLRVLLRAPLSLVPATRVQQAASEMAGTRGLPAAALVTFLDAVRPGQRSTSVRRPLSLAAALELAERVLR